MYIYIYTYINIHIYTQLDKFQVGKKERAGIVNSYLVTVT